MAVADGSGARDTLWSKEGTPCVTLMHTVKVGASLSGNDSLTDSFKNWTRTT